MRREWCWAVQAIGNFEVINNDNLWRGVDRAYNRLKRAVAIIGARRTRILLAGLGFCKDAQKMKKES